jgi:hypothetical protein
MSVKADAGRGGGGAVSESESEKGLQNNNDLEGRGKSGENRASRQASRDYSNYGVTSDSEHEDPRSEQEEDDRTGTARPASARRSREMLRRSNSVQRGLKKTARFKYVSRSLLYVSRSLLTLADTCWQRYVVWQAPQGAQAQRDGADR